MQPQVEAYACFQEVLDLLIRLCSAKGLIQSGEYDLGHPQAERPGDLTADELGDQCLHTLTRAAKFQHVQKTVVGFGDGWERTAFPERGHIARDLQRPK